MTELPGFTRGLALCGPYAFVGLERQGGVMMFDLTNPAAPQFRQYVNNRNFGQLPAGPDSGPEVLRFVEATASPTGRPLVLVAHEISGTVAIYEIAPAAP